PVSLHPAKNSGRTERPGVAGDSLARVSIRPSAQRTLALGSLPEGGGRVTPDRVPLDAEEAGRTDPLAGDRDPFRSDRDAPSFAATEVSAGTSSGRPPRARERAVASQRTSPLDLRGDVCGGWNLRELSPAPRGRGGTVEGDPSSWGPGERPPARAVDQEPRFVGDLSRGTVPEQDEPDPPPGPGAPDRLRPGLLRLPSPGCAGRCRPGSGKRSLHDARGPAASDLEASGRSIRGRAQESLPRCDGPPGPGVGSVAP